MVLLIIDRKDILKRSRCSKWVFIYDFIQKRRKTVCRVVQSSVMTQKIRFLFKTLRRDVSYLP